MKYIVVKLENGNFKVIDNDSKAELTIEIPEEDIANEICSMFNDLYLLTK